MCEPNSNGLSPEGTGHYCSGGVDHMAVEKPDNTVKVAEKEKKVPKKTIKKVQSDFDVKRKAVKLVVAHLRKKLPEVEFIGMDHIVSWIDDIEKLLNKQEFNMIEYIEMRHNLNDVIERTIDEEMRFKLRDSWYSLGKALDKKVKQK